MTKTAAPASQKQIDFIARLVQDRTLTPEQVTVTETAIETGLTTRSASQFIDWLMDLPKKPIVHADGGVTGEGYYLSEDDVYVVVKAKSTGNLYAKRLVGKPEGGIEWEYAPGAMRNLTTATRLTVEQAAATGRLHGACIICGALLTDPESVERGIGPVCVKRLA